LTEAILLVVEHVVTVESIIFPSSLIGTTMQDGGKRERKMLNTDVNDDEE